MRPVVSAGPRLRSSVPFSAFASSPLLVRPDKGMVAAIADTVTITNSFFIRLSSRVVIPGIICVRQDLPPEGGSHRGFVFVSSLLRTFDVNRGYVSAWQ